MNIYPCHDTMPRVVDTPVVNHASLETKSKNVTKEHHFAGDTVKERHLVGDLQQAASNYGK